MLSLPGKRDSVPIHSPAGLGKCTVSGNHCHHSETIPSVQVQKYCLVQTWSMGLEPISLLLPFIALQFALQSHLGTCRQDSLQLK